MARLLACAGCSKPMGEVRDGTLRTGIVVYCVVCDTQNKALRNKPTAESDPFGGFADLMGIFGGKPPKR